jgi:hypothetical protein
MNLLITGSESELLIMALAERIAALEELGQRSQAAGLCELAEHLDRQFETWFGNTLLGYCLKAAREAAAQARGNPPAAFRLLLVTAEGEPRQVLLVPEAAMSEEFGEEVTAYAGQWGLRVRNLLTTHCTTLAAVKRQIGRGQRDWTTGDKEAPAKEK